ncbi:DUF7504 family protein [Halorarum halobium]|uniref:DUF7504 family protein n=1 Tax=Halorarum halobium TaxID=3075121 RepID=UPI0028AC5CED|nr:HalOD1 output domain-containing protein [Halobaculum sp. XH14]
MSPVTRLEESRFISDDRPSVAVVRSVASTLEVNPTDVPIVSNVVDPEALDAVVEGEPTTSVTVPLAGLSVTVNGSMEVVVRDPGFRATLERLRRAPSNVLVLGTPEIPLDRVLWSDPFVERGGNRGPLVTVVPAESGAATGTHVPGTRSRVAVVIVGDFVRSRTSEPDSAPETPENLTIRSIGRPSDLTALGLSVHEQLSVWADADRPTTVRVSAIEQLLDEVETARLFRFLHLLVGRVRLDGGRGRYFVDPERVDRTALRTLEPLFDAVVTVEENGDRTIEVHDPTVTAGVDGTDLRLG